MKSVSIPQPLRRILLLLFLLASVSIGTSAEPTSPADTDPAAAQRPGDRTPSWLMTPVEGRNLYYKTFDSKVVGEPVSYLLYLPPGYHRTGDKRFPVVYWLHGRGGSQQGAPLITERVSTAVEEGLAPPMIWVFVNGMISSSWVDSHDGQTPVETVAIEELIPHIDATYRTVPNRSGRMIEGFSMGGSGAAKWGFRHPELFGSISIIDGALHSSDSLDSGRMARTFETIYGGDRTYFEDRDPWLLAEKNAEAIKGRTPIRIITRTQGLGTANRRFHDHLSALGITSEFHAVRGAPHAPNPLYEGVGSLNWSFYKRAFEFVSEVE